MPEFDLDLGDHIENEKSPVIFEVYQNSIGSEEFKTLDKAKEYLTAAIKNNFKVSCKEFDKKDVLCDDSEIEYELEVTVTLKPKK